MNTGRTSIFTIDDVKTQVYWPLPNYESVPNKKNKTKNKQKNKQANKNMNKKEEHIDPHEWNISKAQKIHI